jgi:hypothetical protein
MLQKSGPFDSLVCPETRDPGHPSAQIQRSDIFAHVTQKKLAKVFQAPDAAFSQKHSHVSLSGNTPPHQPRQAAGANKPTRLFDSKLEPGHGFKRSAARVHHSVHTARVRPTP